ncbi:FtsX-like permease family protein [Microbacterium marinilacus]|uniref:FtsX-like permease family protein n=1 Tax=Microbacterium marinilacus TaxID=415209 RepID=A0ABP7B5U1_9MICO|nr:FtsX-like permease family protein [Microbacterium marinilacus]MBY0687765.1 permease [Microbacterium marinilacus]
MTAVLAPRPLASAGRRAPVLRLTWLVSRPSAQSGAALLLPAVAFAVTTALMLIVLGGVLMFWAWPPDADGTTGLYQALSAIALAILAVPLLSLGGAAARLSARRRDERLATLRLLGATPATVAAMTVLESTAVAVAGAVGGVVLYALAMPLVGLIPFAGEPIGAISLWVGPVAVAAVVAGVALVAAISAVVGLRQVVVSPLGVRTRQTAPRLHWIRVVVTVVALAVGYGVLDGLSALPGFAFVVLAVAATFAVGIAVLGLIGPWAIGVFARVQARRAPDAARLIAARTVLESPKAAWRQVGGVAMTTFVSVVGGSGMALAGTVDDPSSAVLTGDIRTGILITLVVSFLMVACSVGVNQAAAILDRRGLHVGLDRIGMPREVMESARMRATMGPLLFTVVVSALVGGLLVFPLVGVAIIAAPLSLLVIAACFALGIAVVWLALRATRPVLTRVLAEPDRAE